MTVTKFNIILANMKSDEMKIDIRFGIVNEVN